MLLTAKYKPCHSNIDPDKFSYNQINNGGSSYYLDDEFNSMITSKSTKSNFLLLHVNARVCQNT